MIIISIKVQKRQALIPFPRTGKRANLPTIHKMEDSSPVEEIPEYLIGQPITFMVAILYLPCSCRIVCI